MRHHELVDYVSHELVEWRQRVRDAVNNEQMYFAMGRVAALRELLAVLKSQAHEKLV